MAFMWPLSTDGHLRGGSLCIHMAGQTPERQGCSCRRQHGAPCSPSQQFPPSKTDGSIHVLGNCIEQKQVLQAGQQPGSARCQPPNKGASLSGGVCPQARLLKSRRVLCWQH